MKAHMNMTRLDGSDIYGLLFIVERAVFFLSSCACAATSSASGLSFSSVVSFVSWLLLEDRTGSSSQYTLRSIPCLSSGEHTLEIWRLLIKVSSKKMPQPEVGQFCSVPADFLLAALLCWLCGVVVVLIVFGFRSCWWDGVLGLFGELLYLCD